MANTETVTSTILKQKPIGLRFKPLEVSLTLNYRTAGDVTRLSYLKNTIRFTCDLKKRLASTDFTVVNELVVTERIVPVIPIGWNEVFRPWSMPSDGSNGDGKRKNHAGSLRSDIT